MESLEASDPSLAMYALNASITRGCRLNLDLQSQLLKPYLARALVAVDPDHLNGTQGKDNDNMSVLQQHITFFDRDKDGFAYPGETYGDLNS